MQHYRTYFLDQDGHISNAIDMECTDDEQVKECAKKFVSHRSAELWREDQLIAIYAARKGPLPPSDKPAVDQQKISPPFATGSKSRENSKN
jgi:hypothetical protein